MIHPKGGYLRVSVQEYRAAVERARVGAAVAWLLETYGNLTIIRNEDGSVSVNGRTADELSSALKAATTPGRAWRKMGGKA